MIQILFLALLIAWSCGQGETLPVANAIAQGKWDVVERLLENRTDTVGLLLRGEAWRAMGYLDNARSDHEQAWQQAEMQYKIWAGRDLAATLLAMHRYAKATTRLNAIPNTSDKAELAR